MGVKSSQTDEKRTQKRIEKLFKSHFARKRKFKNGLRSDYREPEMDYADVIWWRIASKRKKM